MLSTTLIAESFTYTEYRALCTSLINEEKTTGTLAAFPGVDETPGILEYTHLNEQRMNRLDKTFRSDETAMMDLAKINRPMLWLTLTESWCGDAAQIVPILNGLALQNPQIMLRFILRDQHLDLMNAFQTDGGLAIPKVIFADPATGMIIGSWGPRPAEAQAIMKDFKQQIKAEPDPMLRNEIYEAAKTAVHTWYAHNKTVSTQHEIASAALAAQLF